MRVLLDNCVDRRFARLLVGHEVAHAGKLGWASLQNGTLIEAAENGEWPVLITVDKNLRYQQRLDGRKIAIIVLSPLFVDIAGIAPLATRVLEALEELPQGAFIVLD